MTTRYYRKPAILGALPANHHAVIEASAGTGKTYTLEHLVIELILHGTRIDQILVVTFTEKATAELTQRVRGKIKELLGDFPSEQDPDESCWAIDDAARERLESALFGFDRANISTIHAFCQRVLTEHAFANRRLFEQRQVDEKAAFQRAFKEALRHSFARDPALSQFLTVWLRDDATATPVDGLAEMLLQCHTKQCALLPVFDRAGLEAALDAFQAGPAARDAKLLQLAGPVAVWAQDRDTAQLLAALQEEDFAPIAQHAAVAAILAKLVPWEAALAQSFLPLVRERLSRQKRETGFFDFQDMLSLVAESLAAPEAEGLVQLLRDRYRVALIDEFQDTDGIQWQIFERIFFQSGAGTELRPLYLIGDPKQAIYGFRGADVQTYLEARARVVEGGGVVAPLEENFRSTDALIRAYNEILDQRVAEPFFTGPIRYDSPVRCGRPERTLLDRDGQPAAPVVLYELQHTGERKKDGTPKAPNQPEAREAIAAQIAREIRSIVAGSLQLQHDGMRRPIEPSEIFVLTRTANEGYEVGNALRQAGIAHAYYKQDGLFQTDEAHHVRDLLGAIDDPHSLSRRLKAWLTPFFALTLAELENSRGLPGTHPLVQRLLDWKALADDKEYDRLFTHILEDSGVLRRTLFADDGERELTNYQHLFELLLEQAHRNRATLRELILQLTQFEEKKAAPEGVDGNVQRLESERKAVQIMTMHKAKGLEADVVFLYGGLWTRADAVRVYHQYGRRLAWMGNRNLPSTVAAAIKAETDGEDQRLLYVALTRAKARLYLPYFPDGSVEPAGCYAHLNPQLARVRAAVPSSSLFAVEPIHLAKPAGLRAVASSESPLHGWRPPAALTSRLAPSSELAALRKTHAGFTITSYTRMKQSLARAAELGPEDFAAEPPALVRSELPEDELPGGAATGIFLHELLETVDLTTFEAAPAFDAWRVLPPVRTLFADALRHHDREPRHLLHSQRLVHAALTAPLVLGPERLPDGLCGTDRVLREMEFLYPYPEAAHPRLTEQLATTSRLEIGRGFIKGFVDLVFEHAGKVYFGDWKSDLLTGWAPAELAEHVEEHYQLQAQLYSLALVKMLRIHDAAAYEARFGGMVFCFLRGMMPGDERAGVQFHKPGWADVCEWEQRLVRGQPLDQGSR